MKSVLNACVILGASLAAGAGFAEDKTALATFQAMKPEVALKLAQATLKSCRESGYQVAVAVVDRAGVLQVLMRDQLAGSHTPETARRKAWTAASFRTDTLALAEETQSGTAQSGVRFVSDAMMIGGGIPVSVAGSTVGAVGVSGAPGGAEDHKCAAAGIDAVESDLLF
ncbi:MAG: heme-binding protein [Thiogranum sp.]|nr:heme-binding protein [Thiogranum sp.]